MNKFYTLFRETYKGKTIARTLFNLEIFKRMNNDIGGIIIDLGRGEAPSYERFWQIRPEKFIKVDINGKSKPDIIADLNKPLPFSDNFADNIFLFNVIYIIEDPAALLKEINRILKPGGRLFLTSPFVFNEAKEPADYRRFTSEGLERLIKESAFKELKIIPVGERFSAAAYLISPLLFFWPIKFFIYCLFLIFDKLIPKTLRLQQPCPIGYFVEARK